MTKLVAVMEYFFNHNEVNISYIFLLDLIQILKFWSKVDQCT